MRRYLQEKVPSQAADGRSADEWIDDRIAEFERLRTTGELNRPVHLKIYADIAADPEVTLESFSTYSLYAIATSRISEREGEKVVRKQIDSEKRQRVIERVAWWLWDSFDGRSLHFVADLVPDAVIGRDLLDDQQYERDNLYREIFTGSFLERKFGQNYYFSHRSFLEFFVARRLESAEKHEINVRSIFKNINPEILSFLKQSPAYQAFLAYVYKGIQRYSGEMPVLLLEEVNKFAVENGTVDAQTAIQVLIRYYGFLRAEALDVTAFSRMVTVDLESKNQDHRETSLYFALSVLKARPHPEAVLVLLKSLVKSVSWSNFRTGGAATSLSKHTYSRQNIGEYVFVRFARIAAERTREGQPVIAFDVAKAFDEVQDKRSPKIVIGGVTQPPQTPPAVRAEFAEVFLDIAARDQNTALEVLRTGVA